MRLMRRTLVSLVPNLQKLSSRSLTVFTGSYPARTLLRFAEFSRRSKQFKRYVGTRICEILATLVVDGNSLRLSTVLDSSLTAGSLDVLPTTAMPKQPTVKISEALLDGSNVYYRVFVNGVEKPSLVFVKAPDRTVHGEAALKEWCEHNLDRLESGKVIEANLSRTAET